MATARELSGPVDGIHKHCAFLVISKMQPKEDNALCRCILADMADASDRIANIAQLPVGMIP